MDYLSDNPPLVVVLTALDLEYEAVRSHLTGIRPQHHPQGTLFEVGSVADARYSVALAVTGVGNQRMAALAERAIAMFEPVAMLIVGVAGSLSDDVALGDVVVATRIHAYHGGKDDDGGFHARPTGSNATHWLEQQARFVSRSQLPDAHEGAAFRVHFRPIAAGDVVLNSQQTPLARQLRDTYSDAAAIEMESAGASTAAELNQSYPTLTIRGISDRADGLKHVSDGAGWQPKAAANAARFAIALIRQLFPPAVSSRRGPVLPIVPRDPPHQTAGVPVLGFHERPSQHEKAGLLDKAVEEVIDLGTALNTCSQYLVTTERPARYRQAVIDLLARGGWYRCVLLDPDSAATRELARARNEDLPNKILRSLQRFQRFKSTGLPGLDRLEIRLTDRFTGIAALAMDLDRPHATLLYSPYITRLGDDTAQLERADMPHFLLRPNGKDLFADMSRIVRAACAEARIV